MLAFLIPLLIHLINRGKRNTIPFSSLLWLKEQSEHVSHRFQIQNWWLLICRSSIFAMVALLIAQPYYSKILQQQNKHYLLIEPGLENQMVQQILDTISAENWDSKWLNYDLELLKLNQTEPSIDKKINPFDALKLIQAQADHPLSAHLVGSFSSFDLLGDLPEVAFPVFWTTIPKKDQNKPVAILQKNDAFEYLGIEENPNVFKISKKEMLDNHFMPDLLINMQPKKINIIYDNSTKSLQKALLAALKALSEYHKTAFNIQSFAVNEIDKFLPTSDFIFCLCDEMPEIKNKETVVCRLDSSLPQAYYDIIASNEILWNAPDTNSKLPYLLNDLVFNNEAIDKQIKEIDSRPIHNSFYETSNSQKPPTKVKSVMFEKSIDLYFWIMLMLLLLIERYLNYSRNL